MYNYFFFDNQYELDKERAFNIVRKLKSKLEKLRGIENNESISNEILNKELMIKVLNYMYSIPDIKQI
jgi:hypothetical protein